MCWWIVKEAVGTPREPWFLGQQFLGRDRKGVSKHQALPASSTPSLFPMTGAACPHAFVLSAAKSNVSCSFEAKSRLCRSSGYWWCPGEVGKQDSHAGLPSCRDDLPQQAASAGAVARYAAHKGMGLISRTMDPVPSQTIYI